MEGNVYMFLFYLFLFFIEVLLIYNIVLFSGYSIVVHVGWFFFSDYIPL